MDVLCKLPVVSCEGGSHRPPAAGDIVEGNLNATLLGIGLATETSEETRCAPPKLQVTSCKLRVASTEHASYRTCKLQNMQVTSF